MEKAIRVRYWVNKNRVKRDIDAIMMPNDDIQLIYDALDIDTFDAVTLSDGEFGAFCDDNGLLTSGNVVVDYGDAKLAGNLLFYKGVDNLGRTVYFDTDNEDDVELMFEVMDYIEAGEIIGLTR